MTKKKSLASHKSPGRREVGVEVNMETKVKPRGFGRGPTATDTETRVLKRERADIPRKVHNDHDADMESSPILSPPINIARVSSENSSTKRCRGRPKGFGELQNLASLGGYFAETAGGNLTPHVVTVPIGENLTGKILSFSQTSSKTLCVLSATGTVSSVVLCQSGYVANGLKSVGQFEILHLSGSFTHTEVGGKNRRIGKLSISLAKPDGQVFGGVVVGPLIAASPIPLIVATFKQNIVKGYKRRHSTDSLSKANKLRDLQMVRVPMHIPTMTDDNDNCITPKTAPSAVGCKEEDTAIIENQSSSLASPHSVDKYALQVWQPTDDEENWTEHLAGGYKKADTSIAEKQSSSLASPHSVNKYALQVWQPNDDEENYTTSTTALLGGGYKEADAFTTESQSSSLASPHSVDKYALQVWKPPSDQITSPATGASAKYPCEMNAFLLISSICEIEYCFCYREIKRPLE